MFKSYLRSLFRNLTRNKFYSALNVIGLSIGFATALIILLYVQDELNYDKHHQNYERIYRLESDIAVGSNHNLYATIPIPLGPAMKTEMPEIEQFVRLDPLGGLAFRHGETEYYEINFFLSDSTVFEVFTHEFLYGNPVKSLTEPNSIVLTNKTAEKYFGNKNPVGEFLTSGTGHNYLVTGVIKDLPGNLHLKFDALVSISTDAETYSTTKPSRFWKIGTFTYILISEGSSIDGIYAKFPAFYEKYMKALGDQFHLSFTLMTTPLAQTHFRQGLGAERPAGNKAYILIFSLVAVFILSIASINYMNMATARSANRAKEVGIRKVLGADKGQLIRQFISESIMLSFLALIIAILAVVLLLPDFNGFTDKMLTLKPAGSIFIYLEILCIALFVGLISGSYPAFYLSSFQPITVLKGSVAKSGRKTGLLRKILVIIQFFIAILMIIGTLVVTAQLTFLKNKDLGFNKHNLIIMQLQDKEILSKTKAFKEELLLNPDILAVSNSNGVPGLINWIQTMRIEQPGGMEERAILLVKTDYDFARLLQLDFAEGRDFDKNMGTDALEAVIINQTAAENFGWGKDAIGKKIHYGFGQDKTGGRMLKVIGVVKDFHFKSLHNAIEPIVFFPDESQGYLLTCRIVPGTFEQTIHYIEQKWKSFGIKQPFNYKLMTASMDDMYGAENKIATIIRITTFITIFIALLGLLGLSSYIAEQKTKEVGLRKVHGATVANILLLFYKDFARLILIAFAVAAPVAWWRLSIWLESTFVYYREPQWIAFIVAGALAFIIGLGSISFYIIRVASKNPVEAIKYE